MGPRRGRAITNGFNQHCFASLIFLLGEDPGKIEIIPADDGILDQPSARLGNFLIFFLALDELVAVAERNGLGELV